jgi:hypothetical protein
MLAIALSPIVECMGTTHQREDNTVAAAGANWAHFIVVSGGSPARGTWPSSRAIMCIPSWW